MALRISFTNVKTVGVGALHAGGSSVSSAPACRATSSAQASSWLPTFNPRACGITTSSWISPIQRVVQVKLHVQADHADDLPVQFASW
jgi:hypothetical protein